MQHNDQDSGYHATKCRDSTATLLLLFLLFLLFICCIMLAVMLCKIGYLEKAVDALKQGGPVQIVQSPTPTFPLQPPAPSELFNPYAR